MKKTLLYFNAFLIFSITFSQVNIKDVQALSNINNTIIFYNTNYYLILNFFKIFFTFL